MIPQFRGRRNRRNFLNTLLCRSQPRHPTRCRRWWRLAKLTDKGLTWLMQRCTRRYVEQPASQTQHRQTMTTTIVPILSRRSLLLSLAAPTSILTSGVTVVSSTTSDTYSFQKNVCTTPESKIEEDRGGDDDVDNGELDTNSDEDVVASSMYTAFTSVSSPTCSACFKNCKL